MFGRAVFVLLVLAASTLAADTPYLQEVSFRSVYPGASLGPLPSFPPSWERLPFRAAPQPQAMASLSPMRACVLSLTADTLGMATGDVYGAAFVKGDLMSSTSHLPVSFYLVSVVMNCVMHCRPAVTVALRGTSHERTAAASGRCAVSEPGVRCQWRQRQQRLHCGWCPYQTLRHSYS